MQTMTLEQFRATNDAGGVLSVTLKADGAGFEMQIETLRGPARLMKTRNRAEPRRFVDLLKALLLLRDLGIRKAQIDSEMWRPEELEFERKPRPDRTVAMKAAQAVLNRGYFVSNQQCCETVRKIFVKQDAHRATGRILPLPAGLRQLPE